MIFFASRPHYARHLQPIAEAMGEPIHRSPRGIPTGPTVIAGAADLDVISRRVPVALVEHGAGQRYVGLDHRSWAGGKNRERVSLFLCPRQEIVDANLARYPDAQGAVVGCPALDRHAGRKFPTGPVVAFTFHPEYAMAKNVPELRSAFPHYQHHLAGIVTELRAEGFRVVGHHHPKFAGVERWWRRIGVEVEHDLDVVLATADVLVADNTSALPESAAVGLGTVWLRSPEWRRDVHHGGRFYDWEAFGSAVDGPGEVVAAVKSEVYAPMSAAQQEVYDGIWGDATARAVAALRAWRS